MDEIIEKYPQFFPGGQTICGAYCGKGWLPLVDDMFAEIQQYCTTNNTIETPQVAQIKEKFGALRVYIDFCDDNIKKIVYKYEDISVTICEQCGKPGKKESINGWLKTICNACNA